MRTTFSSKTWTYNIFHFISISLHSSRNHRRNTRWRNFDFWTDKKLRLKLRDKIDREMASWSPTGLSSPASWVRSLVRGSELSFSFWQQNRSAQHTCLSEWQNGGKVITCFGRFSAVFVQFILLNVFQWFYAWNQEKRLLTIIFCYSCKSATAAV